ncbi:hypothetical protein JCGZ_05125 [Jatropha curcas]|uniref:Uncharacterized protein n=1 Tax=Jatropha curcas TaxID=180498 RepID=A0A067L3Y9_JATCU|nr:hypothetical protein JCGZ_05125 [Jatropha curcas]
MSSKCKLDARLYFGREGQRKCARVVVGGFCGYLYKMAALLKYSIVGGCPLDDSLWRCLDIPISSRQLLGTSIDGFSFPVCFMICTTLEKGCMSGGLGPNRRRVHHNVPYYILSTQSINVEQDITAAQRRSTATNHLAAFISSAYAIFRPQRDKSVRRGSDSEAPDTDVVVDKPKHRLGASFSFILEPSGQPAQGMLETYLVSISNYNKVCQLHEAVRLKLEVAWLSNEHWHAPPVVQWQPAVKFVLLFLAIKVPNTYTHFKSSFLFFQMKLSLKNFLKLFISSLFFMDRSLALAFEALFLSFSHKDWDLLSPFKLNRLSYYQNIRVLSGLLQWLINHFNSLDNLFRHNDFEIYLLFEEFSIISWRIPVIEEVPVVPQLDVDPTSMILLVLSFLAYENLSYDFSTDVMPLHSLVDRSLNMDHTNPY